VRDGTRTHDLAADDTDAFDREFGESKGLGRWGEREGCEGVGAATALEEV
jgi:hypothetical protein